MTFLFSTMAMKQGSGYLNENSKKTFRWNDNHKFGSCSSLIIKKDINTECLFYDIL